MAEAGQGNQGSLVRRVTLGKMTPKQHPQFRAGDTVGVYVRVREGEKERIQLYRGLVIKIQGSGVSRAFTVRKISSGVGVERTFPYQSPAIDRVEVISTGKVRRGRLLYLRGLQGKAASIESELVTQPDGSAAATAAKGAAAAASRPQAGAPGEGDSSSEDAESVSDTTAKE